MNYWDVFKTMGEKRKDIRVVPISNIMGVRIVGKTGQVTIAVDLRTATDLRGKTKKFCGAFVLADKTDFDEIDNSEDLEYNLDDEPK